MKAETVNPQRIDPNRLAAFIDGTLRPDERSAVIEELNRSPQDYESFLIATEVRQRVVDSDVPSAHNRSPARQMRRWLAGLSAAAAIIIVFMIMNDEQPGTDARFVLALAEEFGSALEATGTTSPLSESWLYSGWASTRGGSADLPTEAIEFRVGARNATLVIALMLEDTVAAIRLAADMAELLRKVNGGGFIAQNFRAAVRSPSDSALARGRAILNAPADLLGDSPWFQLGAWSATAQLAVHSPTVAFFTEESRKVLTSVATRLRNDVKAADVLDSIDAVLAAWPPDSNASADSASISALITHAAH